LYRDLFKYFKEDGSYSSNIDISSSERPFVLKVLDHSHIDLLSMDKKLLVQFWRYYRPLESTKDGAETDVVWLTVYKK